MQLNLEHVLSLSEILNPIKIGIVLGVFVLALLVLAFTRKWWGLITGIVLLSLGLGYGAVIGVQVKENTSATQLQTVLKQNAAKVQAGVKTTYGLTFSDTQAKMLATGSESFIPTGKNSQQFGTIQGITVPVSGGTVSAPVTLFYDKGVWTLGYTNASGGYTKVMTK